MVLTAEHLSIIIKRGGGLVLCQAFYLISFHYFNILFDPMEEYRLISNTVIMGHDPGSCYLRKPMKWSTGDAPGEYGGPPTTTKLRKYWGKDVDPVTSDEFIWNKEFMGHTKKYVQDPKKRALLPPRYNLGLFCSKRWNLPPQEPPHPGPTGL
ncbi:hypothetical protein RND71_037221 [Anisodus tanguticus]|uniref:Uncharacterized protein n=1 Tax=Anisodus tanguticus TaxID=243964 RepID=A0AAE1R533_9SOLA|nr:hypothetical protein RND71_037221 [Anisodus tanguticus]